MRLPKPRGPLSEWLVSRLSSPDATGTGGSAPAAGSWDDECISLWTLHELSFRGFEDADDRAEWHPAALEVRHALETALEDRLRARWLASGVPEAGVPALAPGDVPGAVEALVAADDGPSLADFVRRRADRDQALELLRQRSVYHLKESDPSAFVVPRLPVRAKAALMELQYDEYGDGDPNRLHAHLFARGLEAAGLRAEYGAYVDDAIPENLEMNNAGSLFGLHRRLRGAAMGHLAAFEMTSSIPSRKMVQGLERIGLEGPMAAYYDEHVEADAIHEHLALRDICGTLAEDEPEQGPDILFGAWTCLDVEARFATAMLAGWDDEQ
ncbi:iron-containing redox enzyme family protein [Alloalcanivorax gelatiniphagus]